MKKIIIGLLSFCFIFANTFAYNSTPKDENLLKVFNNKIDEIYNKNPDKINNFYIILKNLRNKKEKNTRMYYLFSKLVEHIDFLLEKEKLKEEFIKQEILVKKQKKEQEELIRKKLEEEKLEKAKQKKLEEEILRKKEKERLSKKLLDGKRYNTKLDKYFDPYNKDYLKGNYTCGNKKYCKYMNSCEEVKYYYYVCGVKKFDRDGDGIPCENVCGNVYK